MDRTTFLAYQLTQILNRIERIELLFTCVLHLRFGRGILAGDFVCSFFPNLGVVFTFFFPAGGFVISLDKGMLSSASSSSSRRTGDGAVLIWFPQSNMILSPAFPLILRANAMSDGFSVTLRACIIHSKLSSKRPTINASAA